jgi:hypothetical protein
LNHNKKNNSGCKRYDVVMKFKIIVIKRLYNLSNDLMEYLIIARLSFKSFLGLSSGDQIAYKNTIWLFQNDLIGKNLERDYFHNFTFIYSKSAY